MAKTTTQLSGVCIHLRGILANSAAAASDAQLLARYVAQADETAFELLVWRHAPMVWGVCSRILRNSHDAEDTQEKGNAATQTEQLMLAMDALQSKVQQLERLQLAKPVAYIYDIPISRAELGEYLIARMGAERLNGLVT
jgi:hypothetical protein